MEIKPYLFSYTRLVYVQGDYDEVHSYALLYLPDTYEKENKMEALLSQARSGICKLVSSKGDNFEPNSVTLQTVFY